MKFLMMIKHAEHTDAFQPPQSLMDAMGEFVSEVGALMKAGVLVITGAAPAAP